MGQKRSLQVAADVNMVEIPRQPAADNTHIPDKPKRSVDLDVGQDTAQVVRDRRRQVVLQPFDGRTKSAPRFRTGGRGAVGGKKGAEPSAQQVHGAFLMVKAVRLGADAPWMGLTWKDTDSSSRPDAKRAG